MDSEETYCKNCSASTHSTYCSECGQRARVGAITIKETFGDLAASLFSLEAPIWRTLKLLFTNPGRLFREFLAGKRKQYYKPVTFFILTSFIYLLLRSWIDYDPFRDSTVVINDSGTSQNLTDARTFMITHIDKFLFVFVFSLGIFLKLFFYNQRRLAEFIAISFYLLGVYTLFVTLNMFYVQYIDDLQFLGMLAMWLYFILSMVSFFQKRKIVVVLKSFFVFFFAFLVYVFIAFGLSYLIVSFF
ncbi:MAG: DUF3667 domain-containing protein [Flavobacteriaceae bacterium]|nr:DUF3667 domain-containing protein [Flavobacteriaceae bacterium]